MGNICYRRGEQGTGRRYANRTVPWSHARQVHRARQTERVDKERRPDRGGRGKHSPHRTGATARRREPWTTAKGVVTVSVPGTSAALVLLVRPGDKWGCDEEPLPYRAGGRGK